MESNEKSPIIERLCKFINASGLSTSQFADRAGIPRPSMSQMLHGRNKSLNNHVLSKLNDAFPELNIVWLLFGRGDMYADSNFKISEPQNSLFNANTDYNNSSNQQITEVREDFEDPAEYGGSAFSSVNTSFFPDYGSNPLSQTAKNPSNPEPQNPIAPNESSNPEISKILSSKINERGNAKKIASIIVLYTDNSFETFMPSTDN